MIPIRSILKNKSIIRDKSIIKDKSIIRDKKGQISTPSVFGIFAFMITALLVVLVFAGLIYIQGLLHSAFDAVGIQNEVNAGLPAYSNMSAASDLIWGTLDESIQSLHMVAGVYILALMAIMIITNALVKMHPIWFFAYILITVLAIVWAVPISNAYLSLLQSSTAFGGELAAFSIPNWILLNLPVVVLLVSVFGGILLFVNYIRTSEAGNFQ